ncbi:MAG TPA: phosphoenolpyruvate--protein phosphotransferase [Leptolyngbyaceae cyanobacterium]
MVGIVIVSHSANLAIGVQELASQMVQGDVKIALAAGIDDPENPLGTDAMKVHQAIASVYSDDGVVVLMDLGSAVMSAEMALEFLPEEQRDKVKLCEAPIVEGTIAAVVQAANGANIDRVLMEARGALAAKIAHLSSVIGDLSLVNSEVEATNEQRQISKQIHLTIQNQMGLHARPAAKFVAAASRFDCDITVQNVSNHSEWVNGKSINQLLILAVHQGNEIAIAAVGADAERALATLQQLVESNFGEKTTALAINSAFTSPYSSLLAPSALHGIPTSPGIAIGKAFLYQPLPVEVTEQQVEDPQAEWQQLETAIQIAHREIEEIRQAASAQTSEEEAAIFDAHLLFLEDPTFLSAVRQRIFDYGLNAAAAWKIVIDRIVRTYKNLKDPYLQARSADVRDVGQRVLRLLSGVTFSLLDLPEPKILIASDLTPSEITQLNPKKVLGICTARGSATSHSGILAKSFGIPAVMGLGTELLKLENDTLIALNGESGQVWLNPNEAEIDQLNTQINHQLAIQEESKILASQPAITRDGKKLTIMANIGGIGDAKLAVAAGAEGIGLLRSEFLYMDRMTPLTEEEQVEIYHAIAEIISPHPLIIRTLDIGGDKPLSYLNLSPENNPFLGWRGIRFLLDNPDLLKTQLRAILRVSATYKTKILLPMITSIREVRAVKEILADVRTELQLADILFDENIEIGITIEVPSAAIMADKLATEVDFFSIGTNDLSQYVMASDRTNPKVAKLANVFEPAVLRTIAQTVQAAHHTGIKVAVCGELASFPEAAPILVGLGVDELSMVSPAIPAVKAAIAKLTMEEAEAIANIILNLDSGEAVKNYLTN